MARITAQDVQSISFRRAPLGRRGYDEQEVDAFLDEVQSTIAALTREIEELRATRSHTGIDAGEPAPGSHLSGTIERIDTRLDRIERLLAQGAPRTADPTFGAV